MYSWPPATATGQSCCCPLVPSLIWTHDTTTHPEWMGLEERATLSRCSGPQLRRYAFLSASLASADTWTQRTRLRDTALSLPSDDKVPASERGTSASGTAWKSPFKVGGRGAQVRVTHSRLDCVLDVGSLSSLKRVGVRVRSQPSPNCIVLPNANIP